MKNSSEETVSSHEETDEMSCNVKPIVDNDIPSKSNNYQFESNRKYFTICIYALSVILIGSFFFYCIMNLDKTKAVLSSIKTATSPFIIAFFISYLLNPIVLRLKHLYHKIFKLKSKKLLNSLSILTTYLIVIGIITITLVYIIPELGNSFADLSSKFQTVGESLLNLLSKAEDLFPYLGLSAYEEKVNEIVLEFVSSGSNMLKSFIPAVFSFSVNVVKIVINFLLSIVISIYMLNDKKMISHNLTRGLYAFFKKEKVDVFIQNVKECNTIFSKFIIGKSLDSLIIGILCFILMTILKLPYSMLLSVIVGITNMIPYFGPFIGAVPGVILFLVVNPIKAIVFVIMILALQQFDGLFLGPKILGSSTGLKPLWVIFAITAGGAFGGVLGMFLGVPVVAVIFYLLNKTITSRLQRKNIHIDDN